MSQMLLSWTPSTEFDLRSSSLWFEHSRFRNLLTMTLVLAFPKISPKIKLFLKKNAKISSAGGFADFCLRAYHTLQCL